MFKLNINNKSNLSIPEMFDIIGETLSTGSVKTMVVGERRELRLVSPKSKTKILFVIKRNQKHTTVILTSEMKQQNLPL